MKYSYNKLILAAFFIMLHLVSCNVINKSVETTTEEENIIELPRIIFLNLSIVNDETTGEYRISLINKIISEGKIKEALTKSHKPKIDDLEYVVYDKESQVITRNFIVNPLNRTIEYVNESGQLEKKEIKLDDAMFSIRIQLDTTAESIVLKRHLGINSKAVHLLTINIH